jgi:phosphoenolpyruvate-protein kinase (PTS system EI component)
LVLVSLRRTNKYDKLKRKYNRRIDQEKKNLKIQLELLNSQLKNNLIDQFTYERHKAILEFHSSVAQDIKHAEEALKKLDQYIT